MECTQEGSLGGGRRRSSPSLLRGGPHAAAPRRTNPEGASTCLLLECRNESEHCCLPFYRMRVRFKENWIFLSASRNALRRLSGRMNVPSLLHLFIYGIIQPGNSERLLSTNHST